MYAISSNNESSCCSAELSCLPVVQEIPTGSACRSGVVNLTASMSLERSVGGCRAREVGGLARGKQGVTTVKRNKHIYTERQRRVYMSKLLESLQALLPDPKPRKDRCTLLTEVIAYLRSLEGSLKDLARRKAEIMATIAQGRIVIEPSKEDTLLVQDEVAARALHQPCLTNVQVQEVKPQGSTINPLANLTEEIVITFASSRIRGLWPHIFLLLHKYQIDVITATLSTTPDAQILHYIHARVPKELGLQSDDLKLLFSNFVE